MEKKQFEQLVNEVLRNAGMDEVKFHLLKNQSAKKWYDMEYKDFDVFTEDTIYGVSYKGESYIEFNWKSGKLENLLKSFLTKYSGQQKKSVIGDDGKVKVVSCKSQTLNEIISKNKDRVFSGAFYTTLYGIGFWAIFSSHAEMYIAKDLHKFLNKKGVEYSNEFSDAGWVYRFKIGKDVLIHNSLLNEFIKGL